MFLSEVFRGFLLCADEEDFLQFRRPVSVFSKFSTQLCSKQISFSSLFTFPFWQTSPRHIP